jgi:hypothetical protein
MSSVGSMTTAAERMVDWHNPTIGLCPRLVGVAATFLAADVHIPAVNEPTMRSDGDSRCGLWLTDDRGDETAHPGLVIFGSALAAI